MDTVNGVQRQVMDLEKLLGIHTNDYSENIREYIRYQWTKVSLKSHIIESM